MLAKAYIVVLLCAVVHAAGDRRLLATKASPLLSTEGPATSSRALVVDVTFDGCPSEILTHDMFTTYPAGYVSGGLCTPTSGTQAYRCQFSIAQPEVPAIVSFEIAEDVFANGNEKSNAVHVEYLPSYSSGVLRTIPPVDAQGNYPATQVQFVYSYFADVIPNNPSVTVLANGVPVQVNSVHYNGKNVEFTALVPDGSQVNAVVRSGSSGDHAGSIQSSDAIIAPFNVILPSPDCVVTGWSAFSDCTATCTTYSNTFEAIVGTQTRSRTILQPQAPGGTPCPPLQETIPCNTQTCQGASYSRPRAGEYLGECAGIPSAGNTCGPTRRKSNNPASSSYEVEVSGCSCANGCEITGTCCQAYYSRNCCALGNCATRYAEFYFTSSKPGAVFPRQCSPFQCTSSSTIFDPAAPSYYCYCDDQCANTVDSDCCGGTASRNAICN